MRTPVSVAVIGLGDWGQELARRLHEHPQAELRWLCDSDARLRLRTRTLYSHAGATADPDEVLADEALDAIVLNAPLDVRGPLARRALDAEKHVLLQEPIALDAGLAAELVAAADHRRRRLTPTHGLAFHPALRKLKEMVELGRLGELYYVHCALEHLDPQRQEESVVWSLGASEISLLLDLIGDEPVEAAAWADSYRHPGAPDVASCQLAFATGVSVHLHLGWLCPHARHQITVVGSKRTAVFDEHDHERPLTVYEQGSPPPRSDRWLDAPPRVGEIVSPRLRPHDPMGAACDYFISVVRSPVDDRVETRRGAAVVAVLEALQASLERGGARVPVAGIVPAAGHGGRSADVIQLPLRGSKPA